MSTPVKIGLFALILISACAIALTVIVKTQITPEKVREIFIPLAEERLERKVDYASAQIGLFSGIELTDLKIMHKDLSGEFVSIKTLELRYKLWPLLTGKIVIDKLFLDQPYISVSRYADGSFDISDLLPDTGPEQPNVSMDNGSDKSKISVPAVFSLLVNEVIITDGEVHYADRFKNPRSPYLYDLKQLQLDARSISLDKAFPVDLSVALNGSQLNVSASYSPADRSGDAVIELAPLDLIPFAPYYRKLLPGKLGAAKLALNLEVGIHDGQISSRGNIKLDQVDLVLNALPDAPLQNVRLGADYSLMYDNPGRHLTISTLAANLNNIKLGIEGEVGFSAEQPELALSLLLDKLELREVLANLPEALLRPYRNYSLAGQLDGRVELAGKPDQALDLIKSASLRLTDVQASAEGLRAGVSGDISYAGKKIKAEKLLLNYGDQQANLSLDAKVLPSHRLAGAFELQSQLVDLNRLMSSTVPGNTQTSRTTSDGPPISGPLDRVEELGPYDIPLDLEGSISVDRLLFRQLSLDKVKSGVSLQNNRLTIDKLSGQLPEGGELKMDSAVNLGVRGLAYQGNLDLVGTELLPVFTGLLPEADLKPSGQAQLHSRFSGAGTASQNLLRRLQMSGDISLQEGVIEGSKTLERLAAFLGDPSLKILSFKSLTGQYTLQNSLLQLNGNLDSSKTQLFPKGSVNLGSEALSVDMETRLAPEIMNKIGISDTLKETVADENGWGVLPLKIRGTLAAPQIGFNSAQLQKLAVKKAKEEARQKLLEQIAPDADGQEPVKQLLDNTLNKLFGK